MQKTPEAPDRKWGYECLQKKRTEKEKCDHALAASNVARLFAKSRGFMCWLCLLLASRNVETNIIKSTQMDSSPITKTIEFERTDPVND